MNPPKFSIVTATYNAAAILPRTISSLRAQLCQDFEWLVIDGGSSDDTVAQIKAAGELVTYSVSERDRGIADAWNKGITRARAEHVLILNAGDTYDAGFLQAIAAKLDGEQIICSHARVLSEQGDLVRIFRAQPEKLYKAMHLPHNWCAVPRKHYETLGGYLLLPLAMDFDWFHRYYKRFGTAGFGVVDAVLGTYYLGGKSDLSFQESFTANERVLVAAGGSALQARCYRLYYTSKHVLSRWISRR